MLAGTTLLFCLSEPVRVRGPGGRIQNSNQKIEPAFHSNDYDITYLGKNYNPNPTLANHSVFAWRASK
jgi:hypothetical protein